MIRQTYGNQSTEQSTKTLNQYPKRLQIYRLPQTLHWSLPSMNNLNQAATKIDSPNLKHNEQKYTKGSITKGRSLVPSCNIKYPSQSRQRICCILQSGYQPSYMLSKMGANKNSLFTNHNGHR